MSPGGTVPCLMTLAWSYRYSTVGCLVLQVQHSRLFAALKMTDTHNSSYVHNHVSFVIFIACMGLLQLQSPNCTTPASSSLFSL
jgi:hypothetical protein